MYFSKKRLFVLILFICCSFTYSQSNNFYKLLNSSEIDTVKLQNISTFLWQLSYVNPDSTVVFCNKAFAIAQNIKTKNNSLKWKAAIYNIMANAFAIKSNFVEALNYNFKSAKIKEQINDKKRLANSYNNIANIYSYLLEDKKALDYYFKAINLYALNNRESDIAATYLNIGIVYIGMHNADSALNYENKAFYFFKTVNDSANIGNALRYIGNSYVEKSDYTKALQSYKNAIQYIWPSGLDIQRASVYLNMANTLNKLKQYKLALLYCDTAGKVIKEVGDTYLESYIHQVNSESYNGLNEYKKAYNEFVLFKDLSDTLFTRQNQIEVLRKQINFDNDVREIKIKNQEQQLLIQKQKNDLEIAKIQKTKRTRFFIMLLVVFISVMAIIIVQFYNLKKRKQQQDFYTGKLIQNQEEERKRIAFELHDSLGQNLAFIKGSLENKNKSIEKIELIGNIKNAIEEVRGISKNLYPGELDQLGFNNAVLALLSKINYEGLFVSSDLVENENSLNNLQKINCYRIIQESISNTIKHANATSLRVTSETLDGKLKIVIQDNGIGFNINSNNGLNSTGMMSIKERVSLLNGKLNLQSETNKGTKITVTIPLSNV